jgi:UDP-2-acetamido-2-deoxy-ribo-hexuluronate aminotransferase
MMEHIPFIDLHTQYEAYREEIDQVIDDVIRSTGFIQGPQVEALEREIADYVGVSHAITCSSGSDALLIALLALEIGPGDQVITSAFSFFAAAEMISLIGAEPIFVDIDPVTYNINAELIEDTITERTKAILPVDLYGQPADMERIEEIAEKHNLAVIEDAAQSFGAVYRGKKTGNLTTIGCTSFYPSKPLGCFGDGGAIFTNDKALSETMRCLMNHGQSANYQHACIGINGRLDALQAAILRVKLGHFDQELTNRQLAFERYRRLLNDIESISIPTVLEDRTSVFAQYTIRVPYRDSFRQLLKNKGIPTSVHYPFPLYKQGAYKYLGNRILNDYEEACPEAERAAQQVVSLPFGPFITPEQQSRIVNVINEYSDWRMR